MTKENLYSGVRGRLGARRRATTTNPEMARCVKDSAKALKGVVGLLTEVDLRTTFGNANIRVAEYPDLINASIGCVACGAECTLSQRPGAEPAVYSPPAILPQSPSFSRVCPNRQ